MKRTTSPCSSCFVLGQSLKIDREKMITYCCITEGDHGACWAELSDYTTGFPALASALYVSDGTRSEISQCREVSFLDACFNLYFPHGWGNNILMLIENERLISQETDNCCKTYKVPPILPGPKLSNTQLDTKHRTAGIVGNYWRFCLLKS